MTAILRDSRFRKSARPRTSFERISTPSSLPMSVNRSKFVTSSGCKVSSRGYLNARSRSVYGRKKRRRDRRRGRRRLRRCRRERRPRDSVRRREERKKKKDKSSGKRHNYRD
jgi:hypothetical protein